MSIVNLTQISITIPVQTGDLTDKKIKKLSMELSHKFRMDNMLNTPVGIIFVSAGNNYNLLVNIDRLAYNISGSNVELNKEIINDLFASAFDVLMLDDLNNAIIDIQGQISTNDSYSNSKELFNKHYSNLLSENPDIYGVGYRFLTKGEGYNGELKIEPLIRNSAYYFYQMIINIDKKMNVNNILKFVNDKISSMETDYKKILENII